MDPASPVNCVEAETPQDEITKTLGARFLMVGGGRSIRLWRNGRPLFFSGRAYVEEKPNQAVIPLVPPLQARDKLQAIVCSARGSYLSFAIAPLTKDFLASVCPGAKERKQAPWPYVGLREAGCPAEAAFPE